MKILLLFVCLIGTLQAQSSLDVQVGWTHSKIRTHYDPSLHPGAVWNDFTIFEPWNAPFVGVGYQYDCKNWRLTTGLTWQIFGANRDPWFPEQTWVHSYLTVPVLGGYQIPVGNHLKLVPKIGADIGIPFYGSATVHAGEPYRIGINVNAVVDLSLHWKRLGLGIRGHWGITNFEKALGLFYYRHTALTTYLSYTLWDHAKAKQRRLEREQAKRMGE